MPVQLLATKLYVPPLRGECVPRRRLLDRLETGLRRKLTLVSTPPGFGKTTLLSEWCASPRSQQFSTTWLLLDEQDNDPVRFWSYVLAALDRARPGVGQSATTLLQALPPPGTAGIRDRSRSLQGVLTALVNELVRVQAASPPAPPMVLVLDDYHTIHAPAIHGSLAYFLDYLPPDVHLVILTRADPPLPLARLRARDQLLELRPADLRFTPLEVDRFLRQVMILDLSDDAVSTLDTRTEGWAAGLQLAALSLQGLDRHQAQRFVETFAGTDRHVLNYLTEEVLQRQSSAVRSFLLQTTILPYLTPSLCDAVTGQPGSQALLEQLANDNLFITPLDNQGHWYRYHPLFADALRARLQQLSPDLVPLLHRRASAWHRGQGALGDAVRHALAADDPEQAAELVESGYKRLAMRGELVTLHHWLAALPVDLVQSRPKLCLAFALALAYSGHRDQVEGYLHQAETALETATATASDRALRGELAALRAVFASVHWAGQCSLDLSRQALQLLPAARSDEDLWLRVLTLQAQANCHRFQGQVREAEESYARALAAAQALGSPFLIQAVTNRQGQNLLLQGRLRQAAQTFEAALRQAEHQGGELLWFSGELHAHLGGIYDEWHDLDGALHHIRRGIELSQQSDNRLALVEGYLALARLHNSRRQADASRSALDQARLLALDAGVPYLETQVAAHQAWLSLLQSGSGVPGDAIQPGTGEQTTPTSQSPDDEIPLILREFQDLTRAYLWVRQGQIDAALGLLATIRSAAQQAGRMNTVIRSMVLVALACLQEGDMARARDTLAGALALAEPEGYVQTFLEAGDPMRQSLADLCSSPDSPLKATPALLAYADRLLAALSGPDALRSGTQDLLTPRELEILALIAGGASNQEIARQLVVTVGTVKGHVNHILAKLDAHNRTGAVARARQLGLLES